MDSSPVTVQKDVDTEERERVEEDDNVPSDESTAEPLVAPSRRTLAAVSWFVTAKSPVCTDFNVILSDPCTLPSLSVTNRVFGRDGRVSWATVAAPDTSTDPVDNFVKVVLVTLDTSPPGDTVRIPPGEAVDRVRDDVTFRSWDIALATSI